MSVRIFPIAHWRGTAFCPVETAKAMLAIENRQERRDAWFRHMAKLSRAVDRLAPAAASEHDAALRDYSATVNAEMARMRRCSNG
ncbi:hypothetical protein [Cereibacter johrii]|uniref:hypothetical protein n=1 Tax=Cereibacter johrii TaxID=445629 RepID=UPI00167E3FBB|nr:hypothetical protein [Cereibacter johrii]